MRAEGVAGAGCSRKTSRRVLWLWQHVSHTHQLTHVPFWSSLAAVRGRTLSLLSPQLLPGAAALTCWARLAPHPARLPACRLAPIVLFGVVCRLGRTWVLLATDLIGRGMDFLGVNTVVNFDFPRSTTDYIHRVGRTGRAGRSGGCCSMARGRVGWRCAGAVLGVAMLGSGAKGGCSMSVQACNLLSNARGC